MDATAQELLDFWIDEVGVEGWYRQDEALDATIRERWGALWETGRAGGLIAWTVAPKSCLALIILLDQFPRNMFRQDARAFASDARAIATAKDAILRGHDKRIPLPERQFFYLPLMHSEVQSNQDRSVRLFVMNFGRDDEQVRHARAHRDIIRRFGRFPYRNAALGRESTPEEVAFLEKGGYLAALEEIPV
jgi:uncharacterized protein (DUF924 family)